jgi:hypothetical protein
MSIKLTVSAKTPAKGDKPEKTATINVNFPDVEDPKAMDEALKMFGAKAILTNARANWIVTLQSNIRGGLTKGETQAQIQARLANAVMGVAVAGVKADAEQSYLAKLQSMTPAEQLKAIEALKAKVAAAK